MALSKQATRELARWDTLLRASPGPGGPWTTDERGPLEERVMRFGVQLSF